jgi:acyl-coenzyme A synthetase/AMP-(fatty) acid ligase
LREVTSLWGSVTGSEAQPSTAASGGFQSPASAVALSALANASFLGGKLEALRGRCVLIATHEQMATALALVELDGVARRMVLCTPDLTAEQLASVAAIAEADAIVLDALPEAAALAATNGPVPYVVTPQPVSTSIERRASVLTEWVLLTSGTTGSPKPVVHTLDSLAGTLPRQGPPGTRSVWSTFYDIRRYGGMQIYLRAVLSGATLVLSNPAESMREFLARAGAAGVTHISGTPSHWRRALMSGAAGLMQPEYVRLSGEIADQAVLDSLQAAYPSARIGHAFASTEAGVAFDVNDGRAGFPADFVNNAAGEIDLKVQDGTLRIRSRRNAQRYLGEAGALVSNDGYVDTGDLVELQDGRYYFRGRVGGVINVGGLKVHPEEVESVINADPRVRMSLVRARRNPITGAIVVADVVLADPGQTAPDAQAADAIKSELLKACRSALAAHKVPTTLRFVPALELTAAGKLVRPGA